MARIYQDINGRHTTNHSPGSVGDYFDPSPEYMEYMKSEFNRFHTYVTWPTYITQRPKELAKSGLFYTKIGDRVQCPFCHGVLKNWSASDSAYSEHSRHFPYCRFIRGHDVGNIPMPSNDPSYSVPVWSCRNIYPDYQDTEALNVAPPHATNIIVYREPLVPTERVLNISSHNYVDYTVEKNRKNTFSRWPSNHRQLPGELARAGFYHYPSEDRPDRVKCAYCRGKLFNWQLKDDIWTEHSRCFPQCPYIKLCVGEDVIKLLQQYSATNLSSEQDEKRPLTSPPPPEPPPGSTGTSPTIEEQDKSNMLKIRMTSEPVVAILEMGFPVDVVRSTVMRCLEERLGNFPSTEELASMVMEQEDYEQAPATTAPLLFPFQRTAAGSNNTQMSRSENSALGSDRVRNVKCDQNRKCDVNRRFLCKVCMKDEVMVTLIPCGHLASCNPCSKGLIQCPVCHRRISKFMKTYF